MRIDAMEMGDGWGLVATPTRHMALGRDRLVALRSASGLSDVDRQLLEAVRTAPEEPEVLILRGRDDDGDGSWSFAQDLSREECEELGYRLVSSQLPLWRALLRLGVTLFVKVEWGAREVDAYQGGAQRVLRELELECDAPGERGALARLNHWMVRHLSYWLLASFDECRTSFVPRVLARTAARRARVGDLLAAVPAPTP